MILKLSLILFVSYSSFAEDLDHHKLKRSLQPGAPTINNGQQQPWEVSPNVARDEAGNVRTDINIQNHGKDHDVEAGWGKVVRGPGKAKPTWHIGGTYRWRRSLQPGAPTINGPNGQKQPWEVSPNVARDEAGNVRTDINIQNHGKDHDVEAGWGKVVRGPGKAKPTWHVGGTYRWRRSLQPGAPTINGPNGQKQPWEVSPNIARDGAGNVRTDINVQNHGPNHDVEAGWGKVVRGPGKAKPTWHAGGTYRWRRSLQPGAPTINGPNGQKQPWEVSPNIARDGAGNVRTDINVQNHGPNHDVEAGWGKVVRGPGKAKPTWHVGGTYRWRRSLQPGAPNINSPNGQKQPWEVSPNIARDGAGNVRTDINVQNHGPNHDVEAGWGKVVKGPGKAKPTWHAGGTYRWRRSLQPGAPNINGPNGQKQPWEVSPNIARDGAGNVRTDINVQNHGPNHDVEAGWGKVVRGPGKAKPTWHAGGTYRWRRSLQPGAPTINGPNGQKQPWEVSPNIARDGAGNVRTDINVQNHGPNHDVEAGWGKVVRGPGKAKPTWHVGGTYRWRRSLQPGAPNINSPNGQKQPWEVSPNIARDGAGNVRTDINVQNHGPNHDVEAGWGKVVKGPGKAKPTWHAGGTYRWRRSLQPGAPNINGPNGQKQPWEVSPNIARDGAGNVRTDINVQNHGPNHDVEAGWGKVVRGPGKAKPTWHAGGTYRWRRSLQPGAPNINGPNGQKQPWEVSPNIARDGAGNVRTDINVQNHGPNHDVEAGWGKVVRGPGKAKPTWHAGGTYRWRRSLQPGAPNINGPNGQKQPWEVSPNIARDGAGNVRTDINVQNHGPNHDVEAGWGKVVRGPGKAKPTWHVGGTYRWRRSVDLDDDKLEIDEFPVF